MKQLHMDQEDGLATLAASEVIDRVGLNARASPRLLSNQHEPDHIQEVVTNERNFWIRLANTEAGRNSANALISKMYSWRGYAGGYQLSSDPNKITLTATSQERIVGTVTLNIDSPVGLLADDAFKEEIDQYRVQGEKLCELSKLAVDPDVRSKWILASLFHIAFIYGCRFHHCSRVFIEVNPRHRRFYQRMLGFSMHGSVKMNSRVNAPACLLSLPLDYVEQQIAQFGGRVHTADVERSLYPYFFSSQEEIGITGRLQKLD